MVTEELLGVPAEEPDIELCENEDEISFVCRKCEQQVDLIPEDFDSAAEPIECGGCGGWYLCGETDGVRWVEFIGLRLAGD